MSVVMVEHYVIYCGLLKVRIRVSPYFSPFLALFLMRADTSNRLCVNLFTSSLPCSSSGLVFE